METRKSPPLSESATYIKHFGTLDHQASINSVTAYLDDGNVKETTLAWLLTDKARLDELTLHYPSKREQIDAVLVAAARELWAHQEMQKYREKRAIVELDTVDQQGVT
jgi:hypothetical protein